MLWPPANQFLLETDFSTFASDVFFLCFFFFSKKVARNSPPPKKKRKEMNQIYSGVFLSTVSRFFLWFRVPFLLLVFNARVCLDKYTSSFFRFFYLFFLTNEPRFRVAFIFSLFFSGQRRCGRRRWFGFFCCCCCCCWNFLEIFFSSPQALDAFHSDDAPP